VQRQKALGWDMRRSRHLMNCASQIARNKRGLIKQQYGFVADVSKPLWQNIESALGELSLHDYISRPANMVCHNYLVHHPLPPGTTDLLGLGLNYCITSKEIKTTEKSFELFKADARRKLFLATDGPQEDAGAYGPNYIPSLYHKSDTIWRLADNEFEKALLSFQAAIEAAQRHNSRHRKFHPNLTHFQWNLLKYLRRHDKYIVVEADKNLGPCILDRITYIQRGCSEHLGDTTTYRKLTETPADTLMRGLHYRFSAWILKYYKK